MRGLLATLLAFSIAGGCYTGEMKPGSRCGACHGGRAKSLGAAGTIYSAAHAGHGLEGVRVELTDATGARVTMRSNAAGNFYTGRRVVPPFQVAVMRDGSAVVMASAPSGDCNSCHSGTGTPGRIHVP